jgi:hypothetical protein
MIVLLLRESLSLIAAACLSDQANFSVHIAFKKIIKIKIGVVFLPILLVLIWIIRISPILDKD